MAISKKGWLGVARETTPGTAATTPTLYVPTKSTAKNIKKFVYLDEERGTRDGNYDRVETIRQGQLSAKGPWYNDSAAYFLLGFMGLDTATQPNNGTAPTVWSHALTLADVPPALTLFRSFDAATYSFAYNAVEKLVFTFNADNKLFEFEAMTQSKYGTKVSSPPTPTFTTVKAFAGNMPIITLAAGASTDIEEATITLEQKVRVWFNANGAADLNTIYYGERTAKVDFTARFDNDTLYQKYFNSPSTDDSFQLVVQGQNIASTYNQSLTLNFPIIGYDDMEHDVSKENVLIKAKATARPGSTANSLMTATIQNSISSYTS